MVIGLLGVYLGADQSLFVGPLAAHLQMDIGFELGIVLAAVSYLILRPLELRQSDR
jgi:purine-cytosine permease-like protein